MLLTETEFTMNAASETLYTNLCRPSFCDQGTAARSHMQERGTLRSKHINDKSDRITDHLYNYVLSKMRQGNLLMSDRKGFEWPQSNQTLVRFYAVVV
jgi:hypothetical protein